MPYQLADRSNVHRIGQTIAQLMLQQGDINAQRAQASGQIWGGLAQSLGQAVGQGVQAYQTQRAEQRQAQAVSAQTGSWLKFLQGWDGDPKAALEGATRIYGGGPESKVAFEAALGAQRLSQERENRTEQEAERDFQERLGAMSKVGQYYEGRSEEERRALWPVIYPLLPQTTQELIERAGGDPSGLPSETPEWTPETDQAFITGMRQLRGEEQPQEQQPRTLEQALAVAVQSGDTEAQQQILAAMRQKEEATRAPADPQAQEMKRLQLEGERLKVGEARGQAQRRQEWEQTPSEWRNVAEQALVGMPAVRQDQARQTIARAIQQGMESGDMTEAQSAVRSTVLAGEPVDSQNRVMGRMSATQALEDAQRTLEEMKSKGVNTGILRGTVEDVIRKLGKTTDPALVEFRTRLSNTLFQYRRSMTGVQFSARESEQYEQLFPNYRQDFEVNEATIKGLIGAMRSEDEVFWRTQLGPAGARLVGMGSQGSDQTQPTERNPLGLSLPNRGQ